MSSINMKSSTKSVVLGLVSALALTSLAACAKFGTDSSTLVKGAAPNGTGSTIRDGVTGSAAGGSLAIQKIQTVYLGPVEADPSEMKWSLKIEYSHGNRAMQVELFPSTEPLGASGFQSNTGTMTYAVTGICGTQTCSKYAVMIDVSDSANGSNGQLVEYWDQTKSTVVPQKRYTNSDFKTVQAAYEAASGEKIEVGTHLPGEFGPF